MPPCWGARIPAGEPILDGDGILPGERILCGERIRGGELECRYIVGRLLNAGVLCISGEL